MNFKENKPIYLQIADRICDEILQGRYAENDRIPSVRDYAATVEVNANTAMRSYDFLQSRSVIRMQRGIGYFVEPGIERPTPPPIFPQRLERKRRTTLLLFHHPLRYHDPALHLDGFHQNALCGRGIGTSAARHGNRQQQLPTDYGERLVRER